MKYSSFIIILLLGLFSACQQEKIKEEYNHPFFKCEKEKFLFTVTDSIPELALDFNMPYDSLYDLTKNNLKNAPCFSIDKEFIYKSEWDVNFKITTSFGCDEIVHFFMPPRYIYITIDSNQTILIKEKITPIDSISNVLLSLSNSNLYNNFYLIEWNDSIENKNKIINEVLLELMDVVRTKSNLLIQEEFRKPICELSVSELILAKKMIYWQFLLFPMKKPPTPPLPPI